jgi:hypothetical protein
LLYLETNFRQFFKTLCVIDLVPIFALLLIPVVVCTSGVFVLFQKVLRDFPWFPRLPLEPKIACSLHGDWVTFPRTYEILHVFLASDQFFYYSRF